MELESKKLHIIEEVLKINSDVILMQIENFLQKTTKISNKTKESGFKEFSGIWSKDEAEQIEKIIEESCEIINSDDWK